MPVLDNIDLDIVAGDVVAVTGASGSGKTTMLAVLGGLDRPQGGTVVVGGEELGRLNRETLPAIEEKRWVLSSRTSVCSANSPRWKTLNSP